MKNYIIPSLIAKNQKELNERFEKVRKTSKIFQLDVMDGGFVKNKSLWFDFQVPKNAKYEADLMVINPELWVYENKRKIKNMYLIIVPYESAKDIENLMRIIKNHCRKKVGIAINPETSVEKIKKFLIKREHDFVIPDLILVRTVHPGKYGGKFLPKTLEKVKQIRKLNKKIEIEVDGGMNPNNVKKAAKAGANRFVVGSYLQDSENVKKAMKELNI